MSNAQWLIIAILVAVMGFFLSQVENFELTVVILLFAILVVLLVGLQEIINRLGHLSKTNELLAAIFEEVRK